MTLDVQDMVETAAGGELLSAVSLPVKYKGIAVLGSHPATVMKAPFGDEGWFIMACSPHNFERRQLPRFDEWFEIHIPIADKTRAFPYLQWLTTIDKPVWMRDQSAIHLYPTAKLFPEAEYKQPENFGPFHFTSSIAFMMAKAIKDIEAGKSEPQIGLWGIMQASPNEYTYQRPGVQFMILEAIRRGIKVLAPKESKLFEPPPEDF